MITFGKLSPEETEAIGTIVDRALNKWPELDRLTLRMDLYATHAKVPLKLAELADADDFTFSHDVLGIVDHMDRNTGTLTDCFVPRLAGKEGGVEA